MRWLVLGWMVWKILCLVISASTCPKVTGTWAVAIVTEMLVACWLYFGSGLF